jgi:hypothetical protein
VKQQRAAKRNKKQEKEHTTMQGEATKSSETQQKAREDSETHVNVP